MNHPGHTANGFESDHVTGQAHEYDRGRAGPSPRRRTSTSRPAASHREAASENPSFAIDAGSLLRPASKRWYWLLFGAAAGAVLGGMLGFILWQPYYTANAQIIAVADYQIASKAYEPAHINGQTLVGMIQSPELFRKIGEKMTPPISGSAVSGRLKVNPERQSDIVAVTATGSTPQAAIDLANRFNDAVIAFTQDYQRREAEGAETNLDQALKEAEDDLAEARKNAPNSTATVTVAGSDEPVPVATVNRVAGRVRAAQEELTELLSKYTDLHPLVKSKRAEIAALEAQVPEELLQDKRFSADRQRPAATQPSNDRMRPQSREEDEIAALYLQQRERIRQQLIDRKRVIQFFKTTPPGNFRVMQPATTDNVAVHNPKLKVLLLAGFFGTLGLVAAGGELLRREIFDNRLKTEGDVKRVTGLPVLATLGDIRTMSQADRESWAFRTWIALQDRLAYSPNHGLICGVTSSNSGDGRSTWIGLLAGAARKCGFRVLTIATRSVTDEPVAEEPAEAPPAPEQEPVAVGVEAEAGVPEASVPLNGHRSRPEARANGRAGVVDTPANFVPSNRGFSGESEFTSLTASALFTPAMVTEKLTGPETDPLVHIPLPGWTWNLERRKQWQGALNVWRKIDNVVILVELPPASMPESVLLASNLPNLVWLVESGKSDATNTRAQLETLRHARCNLVGTFINRALTRMTEGRFSRWVGCFAMFALLGLFSQNLTAAAADQPDRTAMDVPAQFSVVSPTQRAAWQEKLTLGPGDVLTFHLYGEPLLVQEDVAIGPDGRVSYLEAQNLMAAGLTVDEFRARLNEELRRYRREPQAFVVPVSYSSKKYFVLGKVAQSGVYTLDRPMTLIEAVARARGMETGVSADRNLVELADLSRSFIARNGRHLAVDFEKLFQEGDLTQNIALEPNDYIYFPASGQKEVYVLGSVKSPGPYAFRGNVGAISAIAARGGFTERAWKNRLLVIRGSLEHPQTFIIDPANVFSATKSDLKLEPKDIIYVSDRPWARAEELLDTAASAFVTSAVVVWTGLHVDPYYGPR